MLKRIYQEGYVSYIKSRSQHLMACFQLRCEESPYNRLLSQQAELTSKEPDDSLDLGQEAVKNLISSKGIHTVEQLLTLTMIMK